MALLHFKPCFRLRANGWVLRHLGSRRVRIGTRKTGVVKKNHRTLTGPLNRPRPRYSILYRPALSSALFLFLQSSSSSYSSSSSKLHIISSSTHYRIEVNRAYPSSYLSFKSSSSSSSSSYSRLHTVSPSTIYRIKVNCAYSASSMSIVIGNPNRFAPRTSTSTIVFVPNLPFECLAP